MRRPTWRKPHRSLSIEDRAKLVALRDQGQTWMQIGRVFQLQDGQCRDVYLDEVAKRNLGA